LWCRLSACMSGGLIAEKQAESLHHHTQSSNAVARRQNSSDSPVVLTAGG